jgi:hypothetical protein
MKSKIAFLVQHESIVLYGCASHPRFTFECEDCVNHALQQAFIDWKIRTFGWHVAADWLQRKYH